MPSGGGPQRERPVTTMMPISRARNIPKAIKEDALKVVAAPRHDGYEMSGLIPAEALTGYEPKQQPRISLYYAVIDRELGWQTLSLGPEYPVMDDPSLWGEAELKK